MSHVLRSRASWLSLLGWSEGLLPEGGVGDDEILRRMLLDALTLAACHILSPGRPQVCSVGPIPVLVPTIPQMRPEVALRCLPRKGPPITEGPEHSK